MENIETGENLIAEYEMPFKHDRCNSDFTNGRPLTPQGNLEKRPEGDTGMDSLCYAKLKKFLKPKSNLTKNLNSKMGYRDMTYNGDGGSTTKINFNKNSGGFNPDPTQSKINSRKLLASPIPKNKPRPPKIDKKPSQNYFKIDTNILEFSSMKKVETPVDV